MCLEGLGQLGVEVVEHVGGGLWWLVQVSLHRVIYLLLAIGLPLFFLLRIPVAGVGQGLAQPSHRFALPGGVQVAGLAVAASASRWPLPDAC